MLIRVAILVSRHYFESSPAPGNGPSHRSLPHILRGVERAGGLAQVVLEGQSPGPQVQALILPGGGDSHPAFYGQAPQAGVQVETLDPHLDRFQLGWAGWALRQGLPVLGICRGMQVLNVAAGGSLIQDLPSQGREHRPARVVENAALRAEAVHGLEVSASSELSRLLGRSSLRVNSIHHQALDRVARDFQVSAQAPDGTVEAIEGRGAAWQLGVQFHPEDMLESPGHQRLFDRLVEAGAAHRSFRPQA